MLRSNAALAQRVATLEAQDHPPAAISPPVEPVLPAGPVTFGAPPERSRRREAVEADVLKAENTLLERARTALLRREPQSALEALRELRRTHPHGHLAEERDALTVQSLAQMGRTAEAREAAREFRRGYPRSVLLQSVDAALIEHP
jgi:enoyl-CoA hydratase/carnithine racemase